MRKTFTENAAEKSTVQPLTCVPYVVEQDVSAGHKEKPVQGDENQTEDVQGERSTDEDNADDLQTHSRLVSRQNNKQQKKKETKNKNAYSCCAERNSLTSPWQWNVV